MSDAPSSLDRVWRKLNVSGMDLLLIFKVISSIAGSMWCTALPVDRHGGQN